MTPPILTAQSCTSVSLSVNTIGTYPYESAVTVVGGTNPNSGTWQFKVDVSGTISTATLNWDDEDFEIESKIAASFNNAGHSWSTVAVTGSIDTGEVVVDHDVFYDSVTVTSSLEYCTSGGGYGYGYGCDDLPAAEMILCPSKDTSNIDTSHLHDFVRGTDSSTDASWVLVDDLYAVDFDGTNSIDVPSDSAFPQNAAPHSITFWIKADSIGGTILDMEDQYQVYLSGTNLYYRFFEVGSSDFFGRFVSFDDTTSIHHIGLVWNGNNDSSGISVYVDGDYVEGVPQSTGTVSSYSGTALGLTIGDGFDGKLDDIRFYNAELSSAQIAVLASERGICIEEAEIGGLVGGGVANMYAAFNPDINGGLLAGGDSEYTSSSSADGSGGVVTGGNIESSVIVFDIAEGGLTAGGEALIFTSLTGRGGAVVSGSAQIATNISEQSSGGLVICQPMFANGFTKRITLTIPASKVSADLIHFPVGAILQLSSSVFIITDSEGTVLDHELRDEDDDIKWIFFKASLSSTIDNIFYLYHGGS